MNVKDVLKSLKTSERGLSEKEVNRRLERYGRNKIKEIYRINPIKIFFKQFTNFLIYILLVGIIISVLIKRYIDASVISAIVLMNATLGFIQQYKAEKSILKLRQIFIPKAKVFRDGKLEVIPSQNIVPGDIILYEEGDKVLADSRILEAENLEVNEAILTGESNPIEKLDTIIKQDGLLHERLNMLFSGTTIVKGKVTAIVTETGMSTELGRIALKLQEIKLLETPMQKKLDKFAKQISFIVIILAVLIFILGVTQGKDKIEMLLTGIALVISAIPEGLPAIITISLAISTKKMLKNNVLIRRLPAAETLGSVTVICSDKTGTITEEKMFVTDVFCNNKFFKNTKAGVISENKSTNLQKEKELFNLVKTSILSSNARFEQQDNEYKVIGDPTETAFLSFALELGIDRKILTEIEPRIKEISFSSERKMMSILRDGIRRKILYSKGSPSSILEKSAFEFKNDGISCLSQKRKQEILKIAENFEKKGLRVLAFSYKYTNSEKTLESGLIFAGLIGLLDPPRKEVKLAMELCKKAGIKVKMITGDSLLTAEKVGEEIGIKGKVIGGRELEEMTDEELLEDIDNMAIFARISPQQKLRIVEILKRKGEEVAITGDGINDILALKRADIGVAMGKRGSDIARDVSDMILLDDNFSSIVKGIEEGRIVYDNSKKATKFLLASNFDEMLIIAYTLLFNLPLPILPLQILWINLVTDAFPALALINEKGEGVMESKPRKEKSILNGIFSFVLIAGIVSAISSLIIYHYGLTISLEKARTMVMLATVGFEVFFIFSCRSSRSLKEIGLFSNRYIWYAVGFIIIAQLALIFTPLSSVFYITSLTLKEYFFIFIASIPGLLVFEAWKMIKKK